jgi:GR25 family glycosyltransferase involved in LPS biosynthesis
MKKVVSFSLWGNNKKYLIGVKPNIELAKKYYPEFECWFYIDKISVPNDIIIDLQTNYDNVKIIFMDYNNDFTNPYTWRFEPIDDSEVEILLSRDLDSRITERETIAVREWINSDKLFHIMRDHPGHTTLVLAGMFGIKKNNIILSWKELLKKHYNSKLYSEDEIFLGKYIYPIMLPFSMIHSTFRKYENELIKPFIPYDNKLHFVGEVFDINGRNIEHINILIKHILSNNNFLQNNIISLIPKIYIVHYKKLVDRKHALIKMFQDLNITNYEFIENYDRNDPTLNIDTFFNTNFYKNNDANPHNIVKCINMSHYSIYNKIITNNDSYVLILEDDAILDSKFNLLMNNYIPKLPVDFDMAFLNSGCNLHINNNLLKKDKIWYKTNTTRTCCAYLISKKCCEKIIPNMLPFSTSIDHELNIIINRHNLNVYWCEPTIVKDGSESIYGSSRLSTQSSFTYS